MRFSKKLLKYASINILEINIKNYETLVKWGVEGRELISQDLRLL